MGQLGPIQLINADFAKNDVWQRSGSRTYRAWFDLDSDEVFVLNNTSFLVGGATLMVNQSHPSDSLAIVKNISVSLEVTEPVIYTQFDEFGEEYTNANNGTYAYQWLFKIDFGPWSPLEHTPDGNPLNVPVKFRLEGVNVPIPLFQDVNLDMDGHGTPILNSAYDYFDPPIEGDDLQFVLTVYRNEAATISIPATMAFSNTLNESSWNGFDPKCVKCDPIKFPEISYSQESNVYYYAFEYVFRIRLDNWKKKVLDMGYRRLDPSDSTKRQTILVDGVPISSPAMLDGSGNDLPPPVSPTQIKVFEFDIYKTMDFGAFDMDTLFTLPSP